MGSDRLRIRAALAVRRVKQGSPSTHPILGDELRALRQLQREQEPKSPFVFTSERGSPFTTAGFARMVERAGVEAELGFKAHPHMLRHACGFALANKGHDTRALQAYLGHRNIQHTCATPSCHPIGSRTSGDSAFGGPQRLAELRFRGVQVVPANQQTAWMARAESLSVSTDGLKPLRDLLNAVPSFSWVGHLATAKTNPRPALSY